MQRSIPTGDPERPVAFTEAAEPVPRSDEALVRWVADGRLHPEVGLVADWSETARVLVDLRERRVRGEAVLTTGAAR
ncbi:hypothetical protein ACFVAV_20415 [Nocardia sp. NPDC057663]|uniref:hypothetical protein n=1 Tax=Nocardia sp. NPDC057663 TaxID=3346201 RepID=UPI00367189B2